MKYEMSDIIQRMYEYVKTFEETHHCKPEVIYLNEVERMELCLYLKRDSLPYDTKICGMQLRNQENFAKYNTFFRVKSSKGVERFAYKEYADLFLSLNEDVKERINLQIPFIKLYKPEWFRI